MRVSERQSRRPARFVDRRAITISWFTRLAELSVTEYWRENKATNVQIGDPALPSSTPIEALTAAATQAAQGGLPPVHLWNPPDCGDIGLRIGRDSTWYYQNTPISRAPLVRLFSTILRKDPDRYVLVTPVEKIVIAVEDAPFVAVEMAVDEAAAGPTLRFRTNVDDWIEADNAHPMRFEPGPSGGLKPYILVRGGLWALVSRPLYYDLVARGETRDIDGRTMYGVTSAGQFFPMIPAQDLIDPQSPGDHQDLEGLK